MCGGRSDDRQERPTKPKPSPHKGGLFPHLKDVPPKRPIRRGGGFGIFGSGTYPEDEEKG